MTKADLGNLRHIGVFAIALAFFPGQAVQADEHSTPVQYSAIGAMPSGLTLTAHVPAGKTLVIEEVSVACLDSPTVSDVRLFTTVGGVFAQYTFLPTVLTATEWITTQTTRIYADPDSAVSLGSGSNTGGANCAISISGQLIGSHHDE